jgi:hypothetical protein
MRFRGPKALKDSEGEAERFYRDLHERGILVRVGMEASEEAEVRPRGCPTLTPTDAGRHLPENLGTESRESGSAAVALAPASIGAENRIESRDVIVNMRFI